MKETLVVNLFAGPGAGKTTCAWEIASELKKRGIVTEYVPEYAKELVWDEDYETLANQEHIFEEQAHRINRLIGKVDVVVTDSPIILSEIYGQNNSNNFRQRIWHEYDSHANFNLFINRGKSFEKEGRLQNLQESIQLDNKIKNLLDEHSIYYGKYYHKTVPVVIDNIVKTLKRITAEKKSSLSEQISSADTKEEFDRDAFIDSMEVAIDYGCDISQEDYDLYKKCIAERAEENAVEADADIDVEM